MAQKLGWIGKEVAIADVLQAAEAGQFRFWMTSATQSNSGACAYLGFLHALAGSPDVLTSAHLADPAVQDSTRRLLQRVERSSGSSGWLKQLVVSRYAECDAMVNYESMIIEANRELVAHGQEPMIAIYREDGLTIADSPLGSIDRGDWDKRRSQSRLKIGPADRQQPPVVNYQLAAQSLATLATMFKQ